ncbi:hypothetical protein PR202_ga20592 [Eleusine coracana subsp. coracana]|uniref:Uncharacterized protein n=1 Tax=Eleusine coracana subsp. coracana TaxID=191504 RepID=A0AAV5CXJ6_ELECO|nr:hypothetical protein PR202_ga20592 [Eleusine coracana subsp. coracana]
MRLRAVSSRKAAAPNSLDTTGASSTLPDAAVVGGPDRGGAANGGSKDESFFEARPWLDSDSEDDFYSVRGEFTPSRGNTPDHQSQTPFSGRIPVDRSKLFLVENKKRLIELLQEKQHYDDEDDSATDISSDMENSTVHAEKHLKPSRKGGKAKKSSKSGCFPNLIWKDRFKMCRNMKKEQKPK